MTAERRDSIARVGAALLRIRWLVRAPIWLFRARLGFVFGSRLLMLEHVGRASGLRRQVVLEIVDRPTPHRYVVVSGFGGRAQWFRNVEVNPQVSVIVGSHRPASATAHPLDASASSASLGRYAEAHPRAWARLRPILEETLGRNVDEQGTGVVMVAIDLVAPAGAGQRRLR